MKYIGFFDVESNIDEERISHMSSRNKMIYISNVLVELGENVEIISPSWTIKKKNFRGKKIRVADDIELILGPTIMYFKYLSHLWSTVWLLFHLLKNTHRKETIIVYHSLALIVPIMILKILKDVKVILEVEEIYSSVIIEKKIFTNIEHLYITKMYKRIVVSDNLYNLIGKKKDIILYGSYNLKYNGEIDRINNHIVYAGTIDSLKGGAFAAIDIMKYIRDKDIRLFILGTGDLNSLDRMCQKIKRINRLKGNETIVYLGKKEGDEFNRIMNSFKIGLNLQNSGSYMETAFPSKVITYLSYGLTIVSSKVESIYNSPFRKYIYFADDNIKETAKMIEDIIYKENNPSDIGETIVALHEEFREELGLIIRKNKKNVNSQEV